MAPVTAPAVPANTGDSDVALDETPSQFLLFRGLEPSVTEELLAKGVAKLYKSNERTMASELKKGTKVNSTANTNPGAQEGSILRVMIVRDRKTDESWRYGFAEYHSLEVRKHPRFDLWYEQNLSQEGCSNRNREIQFCGEVHHCIKASHGELHPHGRVPALLRTDRRHRSLFVHSKLQPGRSTCVLGPECLRTRIHG